MKRTAFLMVLVVPLVVIGVLAFTLLIKTDERAKNSMAQQPAASS